MSSNQTDGDNQLPEKLVGVEEEKEGTILEGSSSSIQNKSEAITCPGAERDSSNKKSLPELQAGLREKLSKIEIRLKSLVREGNHQTQGRKVSTTRAKLSPARNKNYNSARSRRTKTRESERRRPGSSHRRSSRGRSYSIRKQPRAAESTLVSSRPDQYLFLPTLALPVSNSCLSSSRRTGSPHHAKPSCSSNNPRLLITFPYPISSRCCCCRRRRETTRRDRERHAMKSYPESAPSSRGIKRKSSGGNFLSSPTRLEQGRAKHEKSRFSENNNGPLDISQETKLGTNKLEMESSSIAEVATSNNNNNNNNFSKSSGSKRRKKSKRSKHRSGSSSSCSSSRASTSAALDERATTMSNNSRKSSSSTAKKHHHRKASKSKKSKRNRRRHSSHHRAEKSSRKADKASKKKKKRRNHSGSPKRKKVVKSTSLERVIPCCCHSGQSSMDEEDEDKTTTKGLDAKGGEPSFHLVTPTILNDATAALVNLPTGQVKLPSSLRFEPLSHSVSKVPLSIFCLQVDNSKKRGWEKVVEKPEEEEERILDNNNHSVNKKDAVEKEEEEEEEKKKVDEEIPAEEESKEPEGTAEEEKAEEPKKTNGFKEAVSTGSHECLVEEVVSRWTIDERSPSVGSNKSKGSRSRSRSRSLSRSLSRSRTPCSKYNYNSSPDISSNRDESRSRSSSRSSRSGGSKRSGGRRSGRSFSSRSKSSSSSRSSSSRSRSRSDSRSSWRSRSRSVSTSKSRYNVSRSNSRSKSRSPSRSHHSNRSRSRSVSIPRRRGSPSFLDRRRITSARKRPIPYKRKAGSEWEVSSDSSDTSF